ncbi:unnamed protein product, partial [Ceratitis capitata]
RNNEKLPNSKLRHSAQLSHWGNQKEETQKSCKRKQFYGERQRTLKATPKVTM